MKKSKLVCRTLKNDSMSVITEVEIPVDACYGQLVKAALAMLGSFRSTASERANLSGGDLTAVEYRMKGDVVIVTITQAMVG